MTSLLEIKNLHVEVDGSKILKGLDLVVPKGEIHAVMGPNGSGKSTLAYTLAGHPAYEVTEGEILLNGEDIAEEDPNVRAIAGLFLAMQYPVEIPGVSMVSFLRTAVNAVRKEQIPVRQFMTMLREEMAALKMRDDFLERNVNEGFSGGEKKRFEILQMAMLKPQLAVLDETDSGLDVDALRVVAQGINRLSNPGLGIILITHYTRILKYITPDRVHVINNGVIVESGDADFAQVLETEGYAKYE